MIRVIILISIFFFIIACNKSEDKICIPENLQSNIVAFYPFSNGSIDDYSGSGLSLVNPNKISTSEDRAGNNACAYAFNGSLNQYLSRHGRFLDDYHKKSFSISLWYKPTGIVRNEKYELLCGRVDRDELKVPDKFGEWSVGLYDCRRATFSINRFSKWDDFHPLWGDNTISGNKCYLEFEALTEVWHHLVVTFDGKDRHLYRNSMLSNRIDNGLRGGSMTRNIGDFFIGKGFRGVIDDIIIFDKVLSQNEVIELYNLEPCCQ
jgi:hypothetical protein